MIFFSFAFKELPFRGLDLLIAFNLTSNGGGAQARKPTLHAHAHGPLKCMYALIERKLKMSSPPTISPQNLPFPTIFDI